MFAFLLFVCSPEHVCLERVIESLVPSVCDVSENSEADVIQGLAQACVADLQYCLN